MKFSSLISWACTSLLEKIRQITRAPPVTASVRVEQKSSRATMAAPSYSEYREIMKGPMERKPREPKDMETDPKKESELMKKMQNTIEELENSVFYSKFLQQIQTPQFLNHFSRVLGSEPKFQVVIYGQYCFLSTYNLPGRIKLALILLLKRDFNDRIGQLQVFYSSFTKTEVRALEDLGFSVLPLDENAYRSVLKPTLFFMHACLPDVYDKVLRANWKPENLNRMILLGNDLKGSKDLAVMMNHCRVNRFLSFKNVQICRYLMCIPRFTTEIPLSSSIDGDQLSKNFPVYSWHFFTWFDDVPKMKPLLKPVVVVAGIFYYLLYRYRKCKCVTEDEEDSSWTPSNSFYSSWKPNYSKEFGLGWFFRRQRIKSDKQRLLEVKEKKRMFYVSRAIVLPWFQGLPRKKWARARKIVQGITRLMKKNEDKISYLQLDELIELWY